MTSSSCSSIYDCYEFPKPLDLTSNTLYDDFKVWKAALWQTLVASGYAGKPQRQQTNFIKSIAGQQVVKASADFQYKPGENKNDPLVFLEKVEELCKPVKYSMFERCKFDGIRYVDNFERFLMQVVKQADHCDFDNREERIKYKIISSVPKFLMNSLIRIGDQPLSIIVKLCRESLNSQDDDYVTDQLVDLVFARQTPLKTPDVDDLESNASFAKDSFLEDMTGTRTPHLQHVIAARKAMNTPAPIPAKNMLNFKYPRCPYCGYRHPGGFQSCLSPGASSLWYSQEYKARLEGKKNNDFVPHQSNHWKTEETAFFRPHLYTGEEM